MKMLCDAPAIFCDGTFKTVPSLYKQLYTFQAFKVCCFAVTILLIFTWNIFQGHKLVPLVFVLMKKRRTSHYCAVLQQLKLWAHNHGRIFAPATIRCDFEAGFIKAAHQELPGSAVSGCYFHFCQAIYRKVIYLLMVFMCMCFVLLPSFIGDSTRSFCRLQRKSGLSQTCPHDDGACFSAGATGDRRVRKHDYCRLSPWDAP